MTILSQDVASDIPREDDETSTRSAADEYCCARLSVLVDDLHQRTILAKAIGDTAAYSEWRFHYERMRVVLVDQQHCMLGWAERQTADKFGDLILHDVINEAQQEAARAHASEMAADAAADADAAETLEAQQIEEARRLEPLVARIRRLETDDTAERLARQAIAIADGCS